MAVPDYQSMMLPLLKLLSDGAEHRIDGLRDGIAKGFEISEEERLELFPSGKTPTLNSRLSWAKTYLLKAGLLESPARSVAKITQRGREVLNQNPTEINISFLNQYPEFVEFRGVANDENDERKPLEEIEKMFAWATQKF